MANRTYFGTDGIRGKVGDHKINADFLLHLGYAAGRVLAKNSSSDSILIGRDTRLSGSMIESALQAGLTAAGMNCYTLGVLPTPAIAYLAKREKAAAGIVISASHNPYYDNGVKFFDSQGFKLSDDIEKAIENELSQSKIVYDEKMGQVLPFHNAQQAYIDYAIHLFTPLLDLSKLTIVVDCANGANFEVAPKVLSTLGAKVVTIFNQPDGYNINQNCGATNVSRLHEAVMTNNADIGIAFDGDGDRLIAVDHQGAIVDGDEIVCILALSAKETINGKRGVVGTVMSNLGLEQALDNAGIEFCRTDVGDRYVLEELQKRQWLLGGENSGHIVNLNYTTTGDGLISALQILQVICQTGKSLAECKKCMVKRPQVLINVPINHSFQLEKYPNIIAAIDNAQSHLQQNGRILLRPSGTEPYVRVMVEGNDKELVNQTAKSLAEIVRREVSQLDIVNGNQLN